jgi:hypothetical protein
MSIELTTHVLTGIDSDNLAVIIETGEFDELRAKAKKFKGKYTGMVITPLTLTQE